MLEFDFNELDNDFITIWSKYIYVADEITYYGMPEGLITLANLGQINAIQSVLLFDVNKPVEKMLSLSAEQIKDLTTSTYGLNYNEELIKLNYLNKMYQQYKTQQRAGMLTVPYDEKLVNKYVDIKQLLSALKDDVQLQKQHTLKTHLFAYKVSNNPLILERYYEIKKGYGGLLSRISLNKLKTELTRLNASDLNNPKYLFAYAKHLVYFGNKSEKEYGLLMLKQLAEREFSTTLTEAINAEKKKQKEEQESHEKPMQEAEEFCYKPYNFGTSEDSEENPHSAWMHEDLDEASFDKSKEDNQHSETNEDSAGKSV